MALLNYTYGFALPAILLFSIPLAIFATVTTILAFSVLLFRVLLVYAELALAVIPYYLLGITSSQQSLPRSKLSAASSAISVRRRKRRSSGGSGASGGSVTPVASDINFGLNQSIGPQRDFEGVGGWRLDVPSEDDSLWTSFHSRLELPADHVRRHRRSLTSGSMPTESRRVERSYSPEALMTTPNTSRARTPPTGSNGFLSGEGYFPTLSNSPKVLKKSLSSMTAASGSSGSSKGSGVLSMKQR